MDVNDSKAMLRFRESFRGYNKDDVNAYIEQVNMRFSRKESELRAQIAEMQQNNFTSSSAASTDNRAEYDRMNQKLQETIAENERLTAEIENLKKLSSADSEKDEKSKLYDSMSSQVGNILIIANSNAEKIINEAEEEAKKIKAEAELEAEKIKLTAEEKMNTMISRLDERLKSVSDSYLCDYSKLIAEAQEKFSYITDSMKMRSEQLLVDADQIGRNIGKQSAEGYCRSDTNSENR